APPPGHRAATAAARTSAVSKRPPPGPSVPTKSVSQNWQVALARSRSRPDQRLHPAKRMKTGARPVGAPSPRSVTEISITWYMAGLLFDPRARAAGAQFASRAIAAAITPLMALIASAEIASVRFFDDEIDERLATRR